MKKLIVVASILCSINVFSQFKEQFLHFDRYIDGVEICHENGEAFFYGSNPYSGFIKNLNQDKIITNLSYGINDPTRPEGCGCDMIFQSLVSGHVGYSGITDVGTDGNEVVFNSNLAFDLKLGYVHAYFKLKDSTYFMSGDKLLGLLIEDKSLGKSWELPNAVFMKRNDEIYMLSNQTLYSFNQQTYDFDSLSNVDFVFFNKNLIYEPHQNSFYTYQGSKLYEFKLEGNTLSLVKEERLNNAIKDMIFREGKMYYIPSSYDGVIYEYDLTTSYEMIFYQNDRDENFRVIGCDGDNIFVVSNISVETGGSLPLVQSIDLSGVTIKDRLDLTFDNLTVEDSIMNINYNGAFFNPTVYARLKIGFDIENHSDVDTIKYFDLHNDILFQPNSFDTYNKVTGIETVILPNEKKRIELVDSFYMNGVTKEYTFGVPGANSKFDEIQSDNYAKAFLALHSQEITDEYLKIGPNPCKDMIHIASEHLLINTISIVNEKGQLLETIEVKDSEISLDVSTLLPGNYVVILYDNNHEIITRKQFIKIE